MPGHRERLEDRIRRQIHARGPIPFREFMEMALYDPELGYYRKDRFGRAGDFYTAEQLQPVFGRLLARYCAGVHQRRGGSFAVLELGAGREDLRPFLEPFGYAAVDLDRGALPEMMEGLVLANEFFDALPVALVVKRARGFVERCVDQDLQFVDGAPVQGETAGYLDRYWSGAPEGAQVEVNLGLAPWARRIAALLSSGELLVIDYGFTAAERADFPHGTLLSYRKHQASGGVLRDAGERDLTAHVDFGALADALGAAGFRNITVQRFAPWLLDVAGEHGLEELLGADSEAERQRLRGQWKTLLVSFGDRFRVLRAERAR